ncbi:MAG: STAS domain-containing protein [Phycisphaerae bacterium]|jgi:anti-anti-sigma factor
MADTGLVISEYQGVTSVNFQLNSIVEADVVQSISESLYELVDRQALRKIMLDFSDVKFMSSQMVGVLVSLHNRARAIKGRVVLYAMKPELRRVFQIMNLHKILEFAENEDEALTKLNLL